jgi:DNA-directed RNA polymerase subunit L
MASEASHRGRNHDNLQIENIKITPLVYKVDLSKYPKPIADELSKSLPNTNYQQLTCIINANTKIVNALRRTILDEMKVKALNVTVKNIDTNESFLKLKEFVDRIAFIPLDQKISVESKFSIGVMNKSSDLKYVYSEEISKDIPNKFRIANLEPGKYLKVTDIHVKEGYGYENSRFSSAFSFMRCVDYIGATFVIERGHFVSKMVKTTDVIAALKKLKIKHKLEDVRNTKTRILIIPNKNYYESLNDRQKEQVERYDYIIELKGTTIPTYQSSQVQPNEYEFTLETHGRWEPKEHMRLCCQNLIDRLTQIKSAIIGENESTKNLVIVTDKKTHTEFFIRGETFTIGYLLRTTALRLNPKIGNIKVFMEHALNRTITISIMHPQANKIMMDSIDKCVKDFNTIKEYFK